MVDFGEGGRQFEGFEGDRHRMGAPPDRPRMGAPPRLLPGRLFLQGWEPRLWGLSPAASAVAWIQIKTIWRTVPGKMAMVQAPFMVLLGGFMLPKVAAFLRPEAGLDLSIVLLAIGVTFALMSVQQFSFNSFAVDGAGATMQSLLPIPTRDLLWGKGAAWVSVVVGSLFLAIPLAWILAWPGLVGALRGPVLMLPATLSGVAILVPSGLFASAILPKQVNLGKAIQGNQPHTLSVFIAVLMILPSWGIPMAILAVATLWLDSVAWALTGLLVWLGFSLAVGWALLFLAESALNGRREAILLETQGR